MDNRFHIIYISYWLLLLLIICGVITAWCVDMKHDRQIEELRQKLQAHINNTE